MSEKYTVTWRERLASPLTWHYVGFAILLVGVIALAVRFGLDWAAISSRTTGELASRKIQLKSLELQTAPLRGIDKRLADTQEQIKNFYAKRIPASYSAIAAEIGDLQVKSGVRLTRVQYTQRPKSKDEAPGENLTEISLDAGVTGEYPQIMRFINSMERDGIFFVIRGMGLTGQQGGVVNLRLQVSTWLRPADAAASGIPPGPTQQEDKTGKPGANPASEVEQQ